MMKKRVLFVIPSLDAGGGEKSLVNLLGIFDFSRYDVDLVLFHKHGLFLGLLPSEVNVIEPQGDFATFKRPLVKSMARYLLQFKFKLAWHRFKFYKLNRAATNKSIGEQLSWKHVSASIPKLESSYDLAIGFLEKSSIYYVVEKVTASMKVGFIHNDYRLLGMKKQFDLPYFEKLDKIFTVSPSCEQILNEEFPEFARKTSVMYNVVSTQLLRRMAAETVEMEDSIKLVSVGRLHHQKGFDIAIDACRLLVDRGYDIRWYVLGEGSERGRLERLISENNLAEHFLLLGTRSNPYPYMANADIYVQPSRFEGKAISIDEAKILCKPIVVANFSTVRDQITHGVDGLISELDPIALADTIQMLVDDAALRDRFVKHLESCSLGTESEVDKLYELV